MNEYDKERCHAFSQVLFGGAVAANDLEQAIEASPSYEHFRIQLVLRCVNRSELIRKIAQHWQKTVNAIDGNMLLHMLEGLSEKQAVLEKTLREANVELLTQLKAIDEAASAQAALRQNLEEMRYQLSEIRRRLAEVDEIPKRQSAQA